MRIAAIIDYELVRAGQVYSRATAANGGQVAFGWGSGTARTMHPHVGRTCGEPNQTKEVTCTQLPFQLTALSQAPTRAVLEQLLGRLPAGHAPRQSMESMTPTIDVYEPARKRAETQNAGAVIFLDFVSSSTRTEGPHGVRRACRWADEIEPVATRRLLNAGVLRRPTTRSGIRARWSGSSGTSSSQSAASCRRVKKGEHYLKPSVGGFLILPGSPHVPRDHVGVWLACGGPGEIALAIVDVELTGSCRSSATGARSTTRRCPSWCRGGSGW